MNDITYAVSVDVNNPIIPYNVYVASVLDSNIRYLEITLYQNGNVITLSNTATATASLVTDNVLVNDSVKCTISDNIITVPLEDLQRHGNLDVQVTVTEGTKALAIPFPIQVRVTPNIAEDAQIDKDSLGSYAEVVHEIAEARGTYTTLHDAIAAKLSAAPGAVDTENLADKSVTVEKVADDLAAVINAKEVKSNKKTTLTGNESSNDYYPTTKAVADALSTKAPASTAYTFDTTTTNVVYNANNPKTIYLNATVDGEDGIVITAKDNGFQYFLGRRGTLKIRYFTGGTSYSDWTQVTEHVDNKTKSITASNRTSTEFYPSIKAVVDYLVANYEDLSNKLSSEAGIDGDSTDTEYPTAKAVFDLGVQIVGDINEDITETNANLSDLKAYIGYTDGDILGLHADFENKVFTRLGAAAGLTAGSDFNAFPMYGQRRRIVVDSNGVIDDSYSPEDVEESDTAVDVMVYQPKFYYKVVPLKLEKQSSGLGYHIRKANYYISSTPHEGFKLHPLFYDANGNEIDYVLLSAYEASYKYWHATSPRTGYYAVFHDGDVNSEDTDPTIDFAVDTLKSLPYVKPISGQYKALTKANMETLAQNKSPNWHLDTIKSVSANQLLIAIEYGTFNTQNAIGMGIVSNASSGSNNCSSLTGSTSAAMFNTNSGMASETIYDVAGTETPFNTNGKLAVSYRGMENPWGNIWKHVNGINLWGDGTMGSGQVYIADGLTYNESSHSGDYKPAGFTIANANGYVSAFGYGDEAYDWLFMPSEVIGNNLIPVGDYLSCTANLNGYRIALLGGTWNKGDYAGGFGWYCRSTPNTQFNDIGGRLLFVPTATV